MGYQLWTSPITGYRRKGTRLSELRSLIDAGITARSILEPLKSCPANAPALKMAHTLHELDFDLAGVQENDDGPVIGFVTAQSLKDGIIRDHLNPLIAEHLISDATPLPSVLSVLKTKKYSFVLIGKEVKGIVTRADLNKPPFRIYLFGLISLLEMHLSFWAGKVYPGDTWESIIKPIRFKKAKELQEERKLRGQELQLLECLQFCDKRDLVLKQGNLCRDLGLTPKSQSKEFLVYAEDVRNLLAHGQQDLTQGASWENLIDLIDWIETVVHKSDDRVEHQIKKLREKAHNFLG